MEDLDLTPSTNCILVGNGPAVLESEKGSIIDGFEEVVRFNRFAIKGYEKNVGSKTTIWSTFGRGELPADSDIRPEKIIFAHGDCGNPSYKPKKILRIPLSYYNKLRDTIKKETELKDKSKKLIPSSGILVISWLLENCLNKVSIIGFDNFSKEKSGLHHYWVNKKFTKPAEHDGDWERSFIEKYENLGKIIKL